MRNRIEKSLEDNQRTLGQTAIEDIIIDIHYRDQIPQILLGLQHLYKDKVTLEQVFDILEKEIVSDRGVNGNIGRKGMDYWQIIVCGVLRLNNNWDYDHLEYMVNTHDQIRGILGFGYLDKDKKLLRRRIINNTSLISQEVYDKINELVVKSGHRYLEVENEELKTRVDSFVLESNVKHPTDSNLLMDAIRKVFHVIWFLEKYMAILIIGQSNNELKEVRKLFNKLRKMRRSNSKDEKTRELRDQAIKEAHMAFLDKIQKLIIRVTRAFDEIPPESVDKPEISMKIGEFSAYIDYAAYQIDLINRRVLNGETIPQNEKVYSIFGYYTEWLAKGKAKAPVELGLKVVVMDDQYNFILSSQVMHQSIEEQLGNLGVGEITRKQILDEKGNIVAYKTIQEQLNDLGVDEITRKQITDDKVTVTFTKQAIEKFPNINSVSFDKGFYSPGNKVGMGELDIINIQPKKGKLTLKDQEWQSTEVFIKGRIRHSGVESTINALENHGLDFCPDKGLPAFRRYVGCAVLARNLQVLGSHIRKKELEKEKLLKAAA